MGFARLCRWPSLRWLIGFSRADTGGNGGGGDFVLNLGTPSSGRSFSGCGWFMVWVAGNVASVLAVWYSSGGVLQQVVGQGGADGDLAVAEGPQPVEAFGHALGHPGDVRFAGPPGWVRDGLGGGG